MEKITIWHNPRCSKSRQALEYLESKQAQFGFEIEVFEYLKAPLSKAQIKQTLAQLQCSASDWVRKGEAIYKELALREQSEDALIQAMLTHKNLIERPVIIYHTLQSVQSAIIARPIEKLVNQLEQWFA